MENRKTSIIIYPADFLASVHNFKKSEIAKNKDKVIGIILIYNGTTATLNTIYRKLIMRRKLHKMLLLIFNIIRELRITLGHILKDISMKEMFRSWQSKFIEKAFRKIEMRR